MFVKLCLPLGLLLSLDRGRTSALITIDTASIDFGHEKMNNHARSAILFDVEKFPTGQVTLQIQVEALGDPG